jgi:hypothetical protein
MKTLLKKGLDALRPFPSLRQIAPFVAIAALAIVLPHTAARYSGCLGLAFAGAIMDTSLEFADAVSVAAVPARR